MKLLWCAVLVLASAACTPMRSRIAPPYLIGGQHLSAEELQKYAEDQCADAPQNVSLPPHKFTTDGCSAYPEGRWQTCCIQHDVAYWCGAGIRREADLAFRRCLRQASNAANARFMYAGVRLGGGRFMPFPWRFGYGHPWPHKKPQTPPTVRSGNY